MDDRELAKYFAGLLFIWGAPLSLELPKDGLGTVTTVVGLAIALAGFFATYRAWESHEAQPLLTCVVPLAFCVGVQLVLAVLVLAVVGVSVLAMLASALSIRLGEPTDELHQTLVIVFYFALQCVYWYLLRRQVRWLGSAAA